MDQRGQHEHQQMGGLPGICERELTKGLWRVVTATFPPTTAPQIGLGVVGTQGREEEKENEGQVGCRMPPNSLHSSPGSGQRG